MDAPKYSYPGSVFAALVRDMLLLRRRDFHRDAQACLASFNPPLEVTGSKNIPRHGPCVITINHYHRPGFGAEWLALAVASQVSVNMHWIMTAEFMYEGTWYRPIGSRLSRILLKRIASVYGFMTMPPMPPRAKDVEARSASVRAVLEMLKRTKDPILGLAPEGHDAREDGVLARPPKGVGRFGLLLSNAGLKFIPVGAYEADGGFHLRFGEGYKLAVPHKLPPDEKDSKASQIIMEHIAGLLPVYLQGEFA